VQTNLKNISICVMEIMTIIYFNDEINIILPYVIEYIINKLNIYLFISNILLTQYKYVYTKSSGGTPTHNYPLKKIILVDIA